MIDSIDRLNFNEAVELYFSYCQEKGFTPNQPSESDSSETKAGWILKNTNGVVAELKGTEVVVD